MSCPVICSANDGVLQGRREVCVGGVTVIDVPGAGHDLAAVEPRGARRGSCLGGVSRMRTFDEIASAGGCLLCVEESPRESRNGISRLTFDLPDCRHVRIAALSGASSADSHINGSRTHRVADAPQTFDHCAVGAASVRDSILLIGASGRTPAVMFCASCVPRRCQSFACVRNAARLAAEPSLASAEVAFVDVEQPHALAPLIDCAAPAHVIYLVGADRRGLAPGAMAT